MVWQLVGFLRRLPRTQPTASTIITGIGGIVWIIAGIAMSAHATGYGEQGNAVFGALCILLGLASIALALFAAIDTQGFKNWVRPDGSYWHAVARWMGPVSLIVSIIWLVVGWWIATFFLKMVAETMSH